MVNLGMYLQYAAPPLLATGGIADFGCRNSSIRVRPSLRQVLQALADLFYRHIPRHIVNDDSGEALARDFRLE